MPVHPDTMLHAESHTLNVTVLQYSAHRGVGTKLHNCTCSHRNHVTTEPPLKMTEHGLRDSPLTISARKSPLRKRVSMLVRSCLLRLPLKHSTTIPLALSFAAVSCNDAEHWFQQPAKCMWVVLWHSCMPEAPHPARARLHGQCKCAVLMQYRNRVIELAAIEQLPASSFVNTPSCRRCQSALEQCLITC